jgi:MFS family permease
MSVTEPPNTSIAISDPEKCDRLPEKLASDDAMAADPLQPRTWRKSRKWYLSILLAMIQFSVYFPSPQNSSVLMFPRSLGGSMFFPAIPQMQAEWGCSQTTLLLGITVYCCCFSIGPPIFAPISETIGRRPIYLLNWIVYTGVMFPIAFSQALQHLVIIKEI